MPKKPAPSLSFAFSPLNRAVRTYLILENASSLLPVGFEVGPSRNKDSNKVEELKGKIKSQPKKKKRASKRGKKPRRFY